MFLISERLQLKPIDWNDLDDIHHLHSNPLVNKYSFKSEPNNIEETIQNVKPFIEANNKNPQKQYIFAIKSKNQQDFHGLVGLNLSMDRFNMAEFFIQLHPNHWGKGFAAEAGLAVIKFGFNTLKIHRIEANVTYGNSASIKALQNIGFEQEALRRKIVPIDNEWKDAYLFSIINI